MPEPKTILVIDDASLVRLFYRMALEQAGFRVAEALNGLEALEHLQVSAADLLIVDVNMPQMDGISFLRQLRSLDSQIAAIPALVTSTESREPDFVAARESGANFYLTKPVDQHTLVDYVTLMCGTAR